MVNNKHIGESFSEFLDDLEIREEIEASAIKAILADQIAADMKKQGITKVDLAKKMHTSRTSLDRLLDPQNDSVTLSTLTRVANALGKTLSIRLS